MDITSFTGTAFSVIGAVISLWQAGRARKYRDEILRDRLRFVLIELIGIARKAREECRKLVTPVGKPVRGVDPQHVVNVIRDCVERIKDNAHKFNATDLTVSLTEVEQRLKTYVREQDPSARFAIGDTLYTSLSSVISRISEELDREM